MKHAAIDRFRASTAALAAASTAAERELVHAPRAPQELITRPRSRRAGGGGRPCPPCSLAPDAPGSARGRRLPRGQREEDLATIQSATRPASAASSMPRAAAVGIAARARRGRGRRDAAGDARAVCRRARARGPHWATATTACPFYPPVDLSRVIRRRELLAGPTRRRYRYWSSRWRDVKVLFRLLGRAAARGGRTVGLPRALGGEGCYLPALR